MVTENRLLNVSRREAKSKVTVVTRVTISCKVAGKINPERVFQFPILKCATEVTSCQSRTTINIWIA